MADAVSHDQNFKNLILDYPRQALEFFAPEEAPRPDDQVRITPVRQEQLQERLGASFRELDVPLKVEWADGRREAILFAIEEESDRSRFSPHRLVRYCADVAELHRTDRVVPVVIFLRAAPAGPSVLRLGTERRTYLTLDYLSVGLAELPAEAWMESDNLVARVNLPNMRFPPSARVEVYAQAVRGLLELEPDAERRAKYIDYIDIYAALDDNERERYRRRHAEESDIMAGIVQRARDEGRREGLEQGLRQGMERSSKVWSRHAARQAPRGSARCWRDCSSGDSAICRRRPASGCGGRRVTTSRSWADKVLDAGSLEDVFNSR